MIFALLLATQLAATPRHVAVTFDDLPSPVRLEPAALAGLTRDLLASLARNRVPVIGFVNEGKLYDDTVLDTTRVKVLEQWLEAGQDLSNHTFSHMDLNQRSLADYERDVQRGEQITRPLLHRYGKTLRYFRHPYLHAGNDRTKKNGLEAFLKRQGYEVAPVTIDNSDYIFAHAYDAALTVSDSQKAASIQQAYIAYMDTVFGFYETQARLIAGREFPQILLVHANRLNAASFDQVAAMLRRRGYAFVSLAQALSDPVYSRFPDRYVGPAGISWLHRWAISAAMPATVFTGEPEVPRWVAQP